jgi:hypothetical protein
MPGESDRNNEIEIVWIVHRRHVGLWLSLVERHLEDHLTLANVDCTDLAPNMMTKVFLSVVTLCHCAGSHTHCLTFISHIFLSHSLCTQ